MIRTLLATLATITTITAPAAGSIENLYPETFIVTEVNLAMGYIELETFSGNVFTWEGCEDWQEGDIASAIMNDNGTPEVTDDEIIKLEYSGYLY